MITHSSFRSSTTLDLLRAVAALAVFGGHGRSLLFVDSAQIEGGGTFVTNALYLATSFGHEAVMLFFVLSGFLIGSVVQRDVNQRRWSWGGYFVDRTVRLAIVAVPALVLTAVLDRTGQAVGDSRAYDGGHPSNTIAGQRLSERGTVAVFLANLGFLQTIVAPTFGTNGPLWSLANEFWYYILFPLGWLALFGQFHWGVRLVLLSLSGLWWVAFGERLGPGFLVWMMGVGLRFLPSVSWLGRSDGRRAVASLLGVVFFLGYLVATKRFAFLPKGDLALGLVFALSLYLILHDDRLRRVGWRERVAAGLSNRSFSLYAFHFPLLVFAVSVTLGVERLQPNVPHLIFGGATGLVVLAACQVCWWLAERRTEAARNALRVLLGLSTRGDFRPDRHRPASLP